MLDEIYVVLFEEFAEGFGPLVVAPPSDRLQGAIGDACAGFRLLPEPVTPPLVLSRDTTRHSEPFPERAMVRGWRRG